MKARHAVVVAGLALGLMSGTAKAAYVINVFQDGTDVQLNGSGSLNLTGLSFQGRVNTVPGINPQNGFISVGQTVGDLYKPISGPSSIGPAQEFISPNDLEGGYFGIDRATDSLFVPGGYVSGTFYELSTSTYFNTTIAQLGLSGGSFVFSIPNDTFTVNITGVPAVPLPASAPMFGAALIALGAVGYGLKRKGKAAAAA